MRTVKAAGVAGIRRAENTTRSAVETVEQRTEDMAMPQSADDAAGSPESIAAEQFTSDTKTAAESSTHFAASKGKDAVKFTARTAKNKLGEHVQHRKTANIGGNSSPAGAKNGARTAAPKSPPKGNPTQKALPTGSVKPSGGTTNPTSSNNAVRPPTAQNSIKSKAMSAARSKLKMRFRKSPAATTTSTVRHNATTGIKTVHKAQRNAKRTGKAVKKTAKTSVQAAKKAKVAAQKTAQTMARAARAAAKATVTAVKAIITAIKGSAVVITAGGWVAVVLIVVVVVYAYFYDSLFGWMMPDEDEMNAAGGQALYARQVMYDEYEERIDAIVEAYPGAEIEIVTGLDMQTVSLLFSVANLTMDGNLENSETTMPQFIDAVIEDITTEVATVTVDGTPVDPDEEDDETPAATTTVLLITVVNRTPEAAAEELGFDEEQLNMLIEFEEDEEINRWWNEMAAAEEE